MMKLNKMVTVFVPTQNNQGEAFDKEATIAVHDRVTDVTMVAGGSTVLQGTGTWTDGNQVYIDPMELHQWNYDENMKFMDRSNLVDALAGLVVEIMEAMEQEAVSVRFGNGLIIFDKEDTKLQIAMEINNML